MTTGATRGDGGAPVVRPAVAADLEAVAEVWRAAWFDGHRGHVPEELLAERDREYFRERASARVEDTLVAVDEAGRVVGMVIVAADEVFQLAVDRTYRRAGVGAALLAAAEERIAADHERAWLAVVPGNARARAFYERLGWRDAGPRTYAAPTKSGGSVPVPVRRYVKDLAQGGRGKTPRPSIRLAVPDDAETILTLVAEIAAHQDQSEHVTVDAERWRTMLGRPDVVVLLAEDEEQALGYVSAVRRLHLWSGSDVIALDDLYVRPGHRSRGLGRVLMEELARRHPGMNIIWGVQPDNHRAIAFYERLGAVARHKVICAWAPSPR